MKSDLTEKDLLFQLADLTNKAKFEADFIRNQVKSLLLILGDKFIKDEEELEIFKESIKMDSSYISYMLPRTTQIIRKEAKEEFLGKGIKEGQIIGFDKGMKAGIIEGREEGREEGDYQRSISAAKRMLKKGMSIEDIHDVTDLSIEKINELKEKMDGK